MKEGESEWERMESGHSPAKTYRMSYETPAELPKLSEKSELVRSSPFFQQNHPQLLLPLPVPLQGIYTSTYIQPADIGWPTGNGKKLSCTRHNWARQQAWLLLRFFPFPVGHPMSAGCTYFLSDAGRVSTVTRTFCHCCQKGRRVFADSTDGHNNTRVFQ